MIGRTFIALLALLALLATVGAGAGCFSDGSDGGVDHVDQAGEGPGEGEGEGEPRPDPLVPGVREWTPAELAVAQARGRFPTFAAFSAGVIQRTCSPNPGVCHQTNNYPDLHTDANALATIGAPCNIEMPDPTQGWDRCERPGDVIAAGDWSGTIGRIEKDGPGSWTVTVRPAPTRSDTGLHRPRITRANGDVLLDPPQEFFMGLRLEPGKTELQLTVLATAEVQVIIEDVLSTVIVGDPNQNGVYGAEDPPASLIPPDSQIPPASLIPTASLITPGDLESSYLWGRVTETVPGFRMPLANQPLSFDEYIALACWIQGLPPEAGPAAADRAGDAPIDYDACAFAADPIDYAQPTEAIPRAATVGLGVAAGAGPAKTELSVTIGEIDTGDADAAD